METSRLSTAAATTEARKTRKMPSRRLVERRKSRVVDWETSTAPTTRPPSVTGMALCRVTERWPPGVARVRAP